MPELSPRNSKGQFLPGPMPEEMKKAISRGQIARHQRLGLPSPPNLKKRCTKCKNTKRVPEDFPMRKRKLASGETRKYPAGECRVCNAKRAAAWRARLRSNPEAAKQAYKRWNKRRNKKKRQRYQRDYQRMQSVLDPNVKTRGPWGKYRHELDKPMRGTLVDIAPVKPWLIDWYEHQGSDELFEDITGVSAKALSRWMNGQPTAPLDIIEHALTKLGRPDLAVSLRPVQ